MNSSTKEHYARFRQAGLSARVALRDAKAQDRFEDLESAGLVRLVAEPERDNYFDVFGKPDTENERKEIERSLDLYGCFCVASQYRDGDKWETADSVGMCTGYRNPLDPVENSYVPDLMAAAVGRIGEPGEH